MVLQVDWMGVMVGGTPYGANNDDSEDDSDEDQRRMKVMGVMTDEGLDSGLCKFASVPPLHPVCKYKCAPSPETQVHPLLFISSHSTIYFQECHVQ